MYISSGQFFLSFISAPYVCPNFYNMVKLNLTEVNKYLIFEKNMLDLKIFAANP